MYEFRKTKKGNIIVKGKKNSKPFLVLKNGISVPYKNIHDKDILDWLTRRLVPVAKKDIKEKSFVIKYAALLSQSQMITTSELKKRGPKPKQPRPKKKPKKKK